MSTHIVNFPGADIHTTTLTSVSNVSVGENLDVTSNLTVSGNVELSSNLTVSGDATVSQELSVSGNVEVGTANLFVDTTTGRVGVGVAQPTSRFEVAGNETLQEYPPKAMTGYETYMEGHGVFRVSQSSVRSGQDGAYALFSKDDGTTFWHSDNTSTDHQYTLDAAGTYNGISSFDGIDGEWVTLECPYSIKLDSIQLHIRSLAYQDQSPEDWTLLGSNDGTDWETLKEVTGQIISQSGTTFDVGASQYYKMFALVVTRIANNVADSYTNALVFGEWRLFGTPAPSALEDGHLTLGKALTLPRVSGHPAGAETPRAESLVVHYDTTVDSVVSGTTVVDISGQGNNGTLANGAAYSSTDRALTFDGTDDYVVRTSASGLPTGDAIYSISGWVKIPPSITTACTLLSYGSQWGCSTMASLFILTNYKLAAGIGCDWVNSTNAVITSNKWHYVAIVKKSTGVINTSMFDLYVDGVAITNKSVNGGTRTQSIGSNTSLAVGGGFTGASSDMFTGSISNPKLWNVALTAEEVAAEYALGRTGKSINLTDTALCLGGTMPRAQLDVRGSSKFSGTMSYSVPYYFARQANTGSYVYDEPIVYNNQVKTNYPNSFYYSASNNGYYKPPLPGVYQIHMTAIANGSGNIHIQKYDYINNTVLLNHDDTHFNFTGSTWESLSASALILIDDPTTQGIRIYCDGTGGNGVWAYNTYHGVVSIVWVSEI